LLLLQTRAKKFGIDDFYEIKYENERKIDIYFKEQAQDTIESYFENKKINELQFFAKLLSEDSIKNGINYAKNVRVIWYEIEPNYEYEKEIFARLNIGKIPLTNADLIKAWLLKDDDKQTQLKKGIVIEDMNRFLNDDNVWYFLTNGEKYESRIDIIFENNIAEIYQKDYQNEWQNIIKRYNQMKEFFGNNRMYHKIGFLIAIKKHNIAEILKYYNEANDKNDFENALNKIIISNLKQTWDYDYYDKQTKITLLLFNIITTMKSGKFNFYKYKTESWDIEHIASQSGYKPQTENEKNIYLEYAYILANYDKEIKNILEKYEKFDAIYDEISNYIKDNSSVDIDDISNLALLDSHTNRSYGNLPFIFKRARIIKNDTSGEFVPICTKNAFLKYYSTDKASLENLYTWSEEDAECYKNAMMEELKEFIDAKSI